MINKTVTLKDIRFRVGGDSLWKSPIRERIVSQTRYDVTCLEEARQIAYGGLLERTFTYNTASGLTVGNPKLFPGMRVMVKGITANRLCSGEYIVSSVRHWYDRDGFFTGFSLKRNACENEKKPRPLDREAV